MKALDKAAIQALKLVCEGMAIFDRMVRAMQREGRPEPPPAERPS
jgi:hypothetical protein